MKLEYIISGIVGLMSGALGSVLAPWVNWKIEQKKENRKRKIQLINDLRSYLESNNPRNKEFLNSPDYIRIRPFLSDDFVNELEDMEVTVINGKFRSYYEALFFYELESIEDLWKINFSNRRKKRKSFREKNSGLKVTVRQGERPRLTAKSTENEVK